MKKIFFFTFLLFLVLISHTIVFAQEISEKSLEQLNKEKLEKEIELLEEDISSQQNNPQNDFFMEILAITGIIVSGSVAGFWKWIQEKNTPPLAEQEKVFIDIVKEWDSRSYLDAYNVSWKKIENKTSDVDKEWEKLCVKEFPIEKFFDSDVLNKQMIENRENAMESYLKKTLKIKNDALLKARIKSIQNSSNVEYYDKVFEKLPKLIEIAINASKYNKEKFNDLSLYEDSLQNLKHLMIFTRIRENKKVIEILLKNALWKSLNDEKNIFEK